jgi:hypothetical protein
VENYLLLFLSKTSANTIATIIAMVTIRIFMTESDSMFLPVALYDTNVLLKAPQVEHWFGRSVTTSPQTTQRYTSLYCSLI